MDNYYENPPILSEVPSNEVKRSDGDTFNLVRDAIENFIQDIVQPIVETISVSRNDEDGDSAYEVTDTYYEGKTD